ncbi:ESX secretion-associated protein EspG [Saccharopolyspora taberi]|uniref:ESX secretion-associated protein EspG n=1 Tax=Saccharopolyspora taberi TaxID=60895 RepID=A0ABN3V576_9PSEU
MAGGTLVLQPQAAMYLCHRFDTRLHPLLRVGRLPAEATEDDHEQVRALGKRQLAERRLLEHDDLHPFLDDALQLLARPPLAVGLAVHRERGEDFNAVLVEHGRSTVQAYQADGDTPDAVTDILISRHEYGGPVGNAIELLGKIPPGQGASVSLPSEQLDQAVQRMRSGAPGLAGALGASGIKQSDARLLAQAFGAKRTLDGVLTVRSYDQKVRRMHKLPVNLTFFVTAEGSYFTQKRPGPDGREWFTLAPADNRKLGSKVEEMVRALRTGRLV